MRMLSIFEPGKLVMEDMPRPTLTPGHAIVEIEKCGICGSDVTEFPDNVFWKDQGKNCG
mgnify:CR=1 FL=1